MAPRSRPTGWQLALMAALCLALAPAGDAAARKFQMSGTWVYRRGNIFVPLQFAAYAMGMFGTSLHLSMGDLTEASGFPNGPISGQGGVTATGSGPATLRIPRHRFVEDAMALVPGNGTTLATRVQITTNLGIDAPYAAATLAPGGGPGSFTWCPDDPACVAGGGMRSTDPPQGAGRNGRVIYRAGANQFGGAMQLGLRRGGDNAPPCGSGPGGALRICHFPALGSGTTLSRPAVGGLGSANAPTEREVFLRRGLITQPTMAPGAFQLILYPGPKVTTMQGLSTTGTGAIFYFPTTPLATGPMGTLAGQFTTQYGFGQTTGTVIAQQTTGSNGQDFFTVMGSDARTPLGAGNISLVAGGLSFHHTPQETAPYASFQKISLTLGAPIPSLSPAGIRAAAALVLLAAGWALRRRVG